MSLRSVLFLTACLFPLLTHAETRADRVLARAEAEPNLKWHQLMDTGPFISDTFLEFGKDGEVAALKGIAIKLGEDEGQSVLFDTETLRMVAGFEGQVTLAGTPWDGRHGGNSFLPAESEAYWFYASDGPGWAIDGNWEDPRELGYGPLPKSRAHFKGLYRHGSQVVLTYTVGETTVMEMPGHRDGVINRTLKIGDVTQHLQMLIQEPAAEGKTFKVTELKLAGAPDAVKIQSLDDGRVVLDIPAGTDAFSCRLDYVAEGTTIPDVIVDLEPLTKGGDVIFPETVTVSGQLGQETKPFTVDTIPLPNDNPWASEIRFGAFDFFEDGKRAALSTWNGDVWIADGMDGDLEEIVWRRFASGLYQTLGLKIVDGIIYAQGRDQVTRLHDLNDDGEADFYENFNNDVLITKGFHEFSFDLQQDAEGNFYFSKGMPVQAGGRGFDPWTPHNGTVLKLSADGSTLETYAWGLRAPGGVGVGPNGEISTGENEGSWVPRAKITWSKKPGLFHGVVPSEWDQKIFVKTLPGTPTDYEKPLLWLPYYVDNSSGSQVWVPEDANFPKEHLGQMLHFSYGKSSIYRVIQDTVFGQDQGGVYRLPIELSCAVMRGRFHPTNRELYVAGFRGWQTNGGTSFQRVRYIEDVTPVPVGLKAHENGLVVEFSEALDPEVASDPRRYSVTKWDYIWGPQYGSGRFSIDDINAEARQLAMVEPSKGSRNQIDTVQVRAASLLEDGKSVFLYVPDMTPAMQMEMRMDLASKDSTPFRETIWNTVHVLDESFADHGLDLDNLPEINTEPTGEPGLIMSFAFGSTDDADVVDRLAMTVPAGTPVNPFIRLRPKQKFEAVFDGSLIVETRDTLAFRLDGEGWASLQIDGKTVLEGELPAESEPIVLEPGAHAIYCSFSSLEDNQGRLQLLWSGEEFVWEPVPPKAFRHLPTNVLESKNRIRDGRNLFAAAQCIQCHEPKKTLPENAMPELLYSLPDFENIGNRLQRGWLEQWVRRPQNHCPSTVPDSAPDVAAWLASQAEGEPGKAPDSALAEAGAELIEQLNLGPWAEALAAEAKFTAGGLVAFLLDPAQHHAHTRFPDLRLTSEEAEKIAAWVVSEQPDALPVLDGDAVRGAEVVAQNCMVCHGSGEEEYRFAALPLEDMWNEDWMVTGCLSTEEANQPELGLNLEQKQALLALKNADSNAGLRSLSMFTPREYLGRQLKALNCMECHSGENLIPDITFAGEKLRSEWLGDLFHGKADRVRPWMEARMPAFASRADDLALAFAGASGVPAEDPLPEPDMALVKKGLEVSGMTGYACVTCHAAGATPALQAFEGQGPNLSTSGDRLRYPYYQTWMHWPQRIQPTTIMPRYTAGKHTALLPQFFEGDAAKQFESVWHWMHSLEPATEESMKEAEH